MTGTTSNSSDRNKILTTLNQINMDINQQKFNFSNGHPINLIVNQSNQQIRDSKLKTSETTGLHNKSPSGAGYFNSLGAPSLIIPSQENSNQTSDKKNSNTSIRFDKSGLEVPRPRIANINSNTILELSLSPLSEKI